MIIRINKGCNYRANHLITRFKIGNYWKKTYRVIFDASCQYHLRANKTQVNKLVGVGQVHHHLNSYRVGWRCLDNGKIELVSYCYEKGEMKYKPIGEYSINVPITIGIEYKYNAKLCSVCAYIYINGTCVSANFWTLEKWYEKLPFLYECFPYFGGYMPAPQNIKINIQKVSRNDW